VSTPAPCLIHNKRSELAGQPVSTLLLVLLSARVHMAGSMFDAFYEKEAQRIRDAFADVEAELYHERPVSARHDPRLKKRLEEEAQARRASEGGSGNARAFRAPRSRAVFAQTEFAPDMAEWHVTPSVEPAIRVRGTAVDLRAARVRECVSE
jgi:hypothetical protein